MKSTIFLSLLFLGCISSVSAQTASEVKITESSVATVETQKLPPSPRADEVTEPELPQTQTYVRPTAKKRFGRFAADAFGPYAWVGAAASAGVQTWRNTPEEWGDKWEGFGRRFASNMGRNVISNTTSYALDEAFKLDSHYYRSTKRDPGSRVKNALLSTVTARDVNGKRVVGFPRIVGTYTAAVVATEVWYPARYDYKDGLKSGTISLGVNAAFNLVREFIFKK